MSSETKWRGIHKLTEECGELLQVLGKLGAYPAGTHPDGKGDLTERVTDECADVAAALAYFADPLVWWRDLVPLMLPSARKRAAYVYGENT